MQINLNTSNITQTPFGSAQSNSDNRDGGGFDLKAKRAEIAAELAAKQSKKPGAATEESVIAAFQQYMDKSPAERMREQILGSMGLTEDDVKAMTPAERRAIEDKIASIIKQRMEEETRQKVEKSGGDGLMFSATKVSSDVQSILLGVQEV